MCVLVVAIDDGVRPQTIEAARTAQRSGNTLFVALNKCDKFPDLAARAAARRQVLTQLMEIGVVAEEFGGEVQVAEVSATSGEGLQDLVEGLLLQSELLELRANAAGQAEAVVLDARFEKGRGVVCDVLVRWGCLNVGDNVVVGTAYGKVKAMLSESNAKLKEALPSTGVRVVGLREVPDAGEVLLSVSTEAKARQIAERRTVSAASAFAFVSATYSSILIQIQSNLKGQICTSYTYTSRILNPSYS
jgi:translation initiation factor IF-2